jgi:hypothetical protein
MARVFKPKKEEKSEPLEKQLWKSVIETFANRQNRGTINQGAMNRAPTKSITRNVIWHLTRRFTTENPFACADTIIQNQARTSSPFVLINVNYFSATLWMAT